MGLRKPYWRTRGFCMTVLYLVPAGRVRAAVPHPLEISEVAPGLTVGGIYAARYGGPGKEATSEFGLLPAYVSYGGRKGFYMRDFRADSDDQRQCGRHMPGAERAISEFNWETGDRLIDLEVSSGGAPVINIRMRPIIGAPISAAFPILCVKGTSVVSLKNHYAGGLDISASTVSIPHESPLYGFPFKVKLISTVWDASNIVLSEPEYIRKEAMKPAEKALGTPIGRMQD